MKIRSVVALVALAISFALPSFAQEKDTAADSQKIRALITSYDEAVNKNDAAAAAALYTEDAVLLTPRGPILGRKAIENWYADVFKGWHPKDHIGKGNQDVRPMFGTAGNEAWDTGEWSETGQGKSGGPESIKGYWSAVDIRDGDNWKIRLLTYNVTPASQQTNKPDPQLRERLVTRIKAHTDALDKNDAAAVAGNFTENGILVTPDGSIFGREAIEKYYEGVFKQVQLSDNLAPVDEDSPHIIGTAGNEMWATGKYSCTVKGQNFGPVEAKGYWSVIREGDDWKIRMLTFNTTPAPAK
jgi:uncharacterized protein (TIGR02246 family)